MREWLIILIAIALTALLVSYPGHLLSLLGATGLFD
jgi:hypothetical protein